MGRKTAEETQILVAQKIRVKGDLSPLKKGETGLRPDITFLTVITVKRSRNGFVSQFFGMAKCVESLLISAKEKGGRTWADTTGTRRTRLKVAGP